MPEYASVHDQKQTLDGRKAYVVDARRPAVPTYFARMWIDCEHGMPLRIEYFGKHPAWGDQKSMSTIDDIELHQLPNGGWIPIRGVRSVGPADSASQEHLEVDVDCWNLERGGNLC